MAIQSPKRTLIGIVSAAVAALSIAAFAMSVTANAQSEREDALARYGGERVEVCVAVRELAVGEVLSSDDVEMRSWVSDLLPADVVQSLDEVVGQAVSSPIVAGEPIARTRLGAPVTTLDVPEGTVALSVPSQDAMAVGGAVKPGSSVDVYASGTDGTTLLAQRVPVLDTSASLTTDSTSSSSASGRTGTLSWVTLAAPPELVAQLVAASRLGNLYLTIPGEGVDAVRSEGSAPSTTTGSSWPVGEVADDADV